MIDPGSVAGYLTLAALLVGLYLFYKGGGGVALGHLRDANSVLTDALAAQADKLSHAERELSELRGRTDVSIAIAAAIGPISEWSASHEQRAQARHEAQMVIMELIASRLGPDDQPVPVRRQPPGQPPSPQEVVVVNEEPVDVHVKEPNGG